MSREVMSDWYVYNALVSAVEAEIEDKQWGLEDEEVVEYVVAVRDDYEEVDALVNPKKSEKTRFLKEHSEDNGWYTVVSDDYCYIINSWLQFGFDLR